MEGYLSKKSASGFGGFHPWQKRYFILKSEENALFYYASEKMSQCKGKINLDEIEDICLYLDKHNGCRFDLKTFRKLYCLKAQSSEQAFKWTQSIAYFSGKNSEHFEENLIFEEIEFDDSNKEDLALENSKVCEKAKSSRIHLQTTAFLKKKE
jgi:hypothetical protein